MASIYQRDTDGHYPRPVRLAVGNGMQLHLWCEFQERFKIGKIQEIYGMTEGGIVLRNEDGPRWKRRKILVGFEGNSNQNKIYYFFMK